MFIDFSDVQDGFELLPEGNYEAVLSKIEQKVGRDSGKPYVEWTFDLTEDDYPGRKGFYNTSLQPQSLWKLKELLINVFHLDPDSLSGEFDFDEDELVGMPVILVIEHRKWNGATRDGVADVLPAGDTGIDFE